MNGSGLDFEKPILELERRIEELKRFSSGEKIDITGEIKRLEEKLAKLKKDIFQDLTPWQRVQIARHPKRPYTLDYIELIASDFVELHGDRYFSDDKAIVGGFARIADQKVLILGHQKGRDTKENLARNFGSAHPEGYRKAIRLMKMAERFNMPIICFVDTPGAYPGIGAEERGQSEAIAYNLMEMMFLAVPIVVFVIGEGGSGGALGIGVGDRVYILENSYYSVISPEGCAAILWKERSRAGDAASALRLTAQDLLELKVVDGVIKEPLGGGHRNPEEIAKAIKKTIKESLAELSGLTKKELLRTRYGKFRKMGVFKEPEPEETEKGQ